MTDENDNGDEDDNPPVRRVTLALVAFAAFCFSGMFVTAVWQTAGLLIFAIGPFVSLAIVAGVTLDQVGDAIPAGS